MCNCIDKVNKLLAKKNTKLDFIFTLGKISKYPKISTIKVDGKIKSGPVTMIPSYCPFCGKKYAQKNGKVK